MVLEALATLAQTLERPSSSKSRMWTGTVLLYAVHSAKRSHFCSGLALAELRPGPGGSVWRRCCCCSAVVHWGSWSSSSGVVGLVVRWRTTGDGRGRGGCSCDYRLGHRRGRIGDSRDLLPVSRPATPTAAIRQRLFKERDAVVTAGYSKQVSCDAP
jgi:hypothetical protein